jgi:hypothetical protein
MIWPAPHTQHRHHERGNVFLFIMLGIVLFAALTFTVSKSFQNQTTTSNLSKKEAMLAASDIMSYAQSVERGVNRVRRKSTSESDISFSYESGSTFEHGTPQPDRNNVFKTAGGGATWKTPQAGSNDGSPWFFTGETCIQDLGTGGATCNTSGNDEELLIVLPNVDTVVCDAINERLGIGVTPTDSGGNYDTTPFTGTFGNGTKIVLAGGPYAAACYTDGTNNDVSYVLLER